MLSPRTIKRSLISRLPPQYAADVSDLLSNRPGQRGYLQPLRPPANPGSPALNRCHSINVSGSEKRFAGAALRNAPFTPEDSRAQEPPPLPASGRASPSGARSTGPGGHAAPRGAVGLRQARLHPSSARSGAVPVTFPRGGQAYIHAYIYLYTHTCTYLGAYVYIYICVCVYARCVYIYVCIYIQNTCVYICVHTRIHLYTRTYAHPRPPATHGRVSPRGAPRTALPGLPAPAAPSSR